jgi:hypothetical protein
MKKTITYDTMRAERITYAPIDQIDTDGWGYKVEIFCQEGAGYFRTAVYDLPARVAQGGMPVPKITIMAEEEVARWLWEHNQLPPVGSSMRLYRAHQHLEENDEEMIGYSGDQVIR